MEKDIIVGREDKKREEGEAMHKTVPVEEEEIAIKDVPEENKAQEHEIKLNFTQEEIDMLAKKHQRVAPQIGDVEIKSVEKKDDLETFKKLKYKEITHNKRKLFLTNLPPKVKREELREFFHTYLATLNKKKPDKNSVTDVVFCENGGYVIIEFSNREESKICLGLDNSDWQGYKIRVRTPQRFCEEYNASKGKILVQGSYESTADHKIYMGCIPSSMDEGKIKQLCESFGMLRSFNINKDPDNPLKHKGFAFFEYVDEKQTDRAIKALNGLDIGDKKLKVQRATQGQKPKTEIKKASIQKNHGFLTNVLPEKRIPIPLITSSPSRVVQFLNMLTGEDLMDDEEYASIKEDILNACLPFGEILEIKIPRPNATTGVASCAVGKAFVKFGHVCAAKLARFKLSGRKFNRRLVVASFYPEQAFDEDQLHLC